MRLRFICLLGSVACLGVAAACGGADQLADDSGIDSGGNDATVDVTPPPPDSGTDVTVDDTGTGDTGTGDTGATDGGTTQDSGVTIGTWKCGATTVTDCSQCTGYTQPCAYCNTLDASVVTGVCTQLNTSCFNNQIPQGYQDCNCADASDCIESYQVCVAFGQGGGHCHTCTDGTGNNGLTCNGGGTCAPDAGGCK
jgi:hypothetical protein